MVAGNANSSPWPIIAWTFPFVKVCDPLRAVAGEAAQIRADVSHRQQPSLPADLNDPRFNAALCGNSL